MSTKRILYYDALKIAASFFVILIHVTAEQYYTYALDVNWYINYGYNSISRWAVPVFCMVTGAIMLSRELYPATVFKRPILRLSLLLLFWGMFYWLFYSMDFSINNIWISFKYLLEGKAYSHLWYLYMLIGFYLISPALCIITKYSSKQTLEYLLLFIFVSSFVIPDIARIFEPVNGLLDAFKLSFTGEYLFYFLSGYYISKYPLKKTFGIIYSLLGITVLTVTAIGYFSIYGYYTSKFFSDNETPLVIVGIGATSVFILFQLLSPIFNRKPISRLINFLAPLTFGIYMVHFVIEKILLIAGIHSCMINPILGAPLVSLIIFVLCIFVSFITSKIPIVKHLIQ